MSSLAQFASAIQDAPLVLNNAGKVANVVKELVRNAEKTLEEFADAEALVSAKEVGEFRQQLRLTRSAGRQFCELRRGLKNIWSNFQQFKTTLEQRQQLSREDLRRCAAQLQQLQTAGKRCLAQHQEFQRCLSATVAAGAQLIAACKSAGDRAEFKEANTKIFGFSGAGILGIAGVAFLTFAGGRPSLLAAAGATGVAATAAGAVTINFADRLDNFGQEFQQRADNLEASLNALNDQADDLEDDRAASRILMESIESAIQQFQQQEQLRKLEKKRQRQQGEMEKKFLEMELTRGS